MATWRRWWTAPPGDTLTELEYFQVHALLVARTPFFYERYYLTIGPLLLAAAPRSSSWPDALCVLLADWWHRH